MGRDGNGVRRAKNSTGGSVLFGRAESSGRISRAKSGGRWRRRAAMAVVCAALSVGLGSAQTSASGEYQSKANFLSQFPNFIEWPETTFASPQASFAICVLGDF